MEIQMNFTGKKFLNDEEFIKYYDQLWKETPHYSLNWPSPEQIAQNKVEGLNIVNLPASTELENEQWEKLPDNPKYLVSTRGRIKYEVSKKNFQIIHQDDKYDKRPGYLVLKPQPEYANLRINKTKEVYTLVAKTFLGKTDGDGFQVHHIHNNGYDCSTEELILLTVRQHKAVHLDYHMSVTELVKFLNNCYDEERIKNHLANYKLNKLGIIDCGVWKRNNKKYCHILPEGDKERNLILDYYEKDFLSLFNEQQSSLHTDFSHLNSSQALCFNLFRPLEKNHRLSIIDSSITKDAMAEFEHVEKDSFEKSKNLRDKTNFDFFVSDNEKKYFFEIKYTEQGFGSVPFIDETHHKKYEDYYQNQLSKIAQESISEKDFFDKYQLWRNVCHADSGIVYFVFLKTRHSLKTEVEEIKRKCKPIYQEHIRFIYIEDIVQSCLKIKDDERFHNHYEEFFEKYLRNI